MKVEIQIPNAPSKYMSLQTVDAQNLTPIGMLEVPVNFIYLYFLLQMCPLTWRPKTLVVLGPPADTHDTFPRLRVVGLHANGTHHGILSRTRSNVHKTICGEDGQVVVGLLGNVGLQKPVKNT